ncbi:hypothetical protein BJX63DRAFT_383933 [Aspergillus granulosus]|uniref:Uncharacterized protein n=1 Tax=Aspergillus granulosus TaxID=176169 RepID=A0ABR4HT53_9EURO
MALSTEALVGIIAVSVTVVPIGISMFKCWTQRRLRYSQPDIESNSGPSRYESGYSKYPVIDGLDRHQALSWRPYSSLGRVCSAEVIAMPYYHGTWRPLRVDTICLDIQTTVSQSSVTSRISTA